MGTTIAQIRHVVFIGETGAGKSSVINLIADYDHAAVTPDAMPCTTRHASYDVLIEGRTYRLWDTPGLNKPSGFRLFRRTSTNRESIKRFLQERYRRRELDLLVLCVQGGRAHEGMSRAYKIFCRASRQFAIPVVIAITQLERQQPTMETWWQNNEGLLEDLGWASQQEIWDLISKEYRQRPRSIPSPDGEYLDTPQRSCVVC